MMLRRTLLCAIISLWSAGTLADAVLTPVYGDGALVGFNSIDPPHAASSDDGNPGATLGEQRRWAFERALEFWERRLDSNVVIEVAAQMTDKACDEFSAILGSAGPRSVSRDWAAGPGGSAPSEANTWYSIALANRIANEDLIPGTPDITSEFNKKIDESTSCLGSNTWYYALGEAPPGTTSFFATALHEIGHGIGVLTFVDKASGARFSDRDDIYMKFLEDHSTGKLWSEMNDTERMNSAIDTSDLHWVGANVTAALGSLTGGVSGGHAQMYAPDPVQGGSSVSHWDTAIQTADGNHELMEPSATGSEKLLLTGEMLQDMGWNDVVANNCTFASSRQTLSSIYTGTNEHEACISVTYDGAVIISGDTSATAGREVVLQNDFTVEQGATFSVEIDPDIGL
ncbi:hypothetical protein QWI17_15845 [Gilvimarinus sp. SDUM040013]|uniref:Uncharacterized protein n=1 Tax=Gilvimarinus gilvus TaxID=3058038 RepID=A0ABU4RZG0_9GAMM|nr:hypothetical protein [Gilvimarinus sp. SDUM040013]MDO3387314.1 hypothetical protein [Gilvimarinus sp. SDUM040013]MDX6849003.1 hypothetical protein [Gilvimarinus sp. SDUM040013]